MTTSPGEVYLVDLGIAAKTRPMLVVSRKDDDAPRALAVCAPITTSYRESDYEIPIGKPTFLHYESYVNVQGLQAIQSHELKQLIGTLHDANMATVKEALSFLFELQ